ncbi:BTB/POZ domain-containing protein [Arachis hypogaea]|nr:BTB/POZ domain-containing protein [Arachis hypogaea]
MLSAEKASTKGQAWFCTTGLPSDIVVEVDDMTFHLHKFPLMSKSRKLHQLITQQEATHSSVARTQTKDEDDYDEDEIVEEQCHVTFTGFPGGSEAFETAAKFCYGVKIDLSPSNVASLRCAGEFLEYKAGPNGGGNGGGWRAALGRKFGCKFKTQVCDSHESTVVDARKGRHQQQQQHHPHHE